MTYGELRYDDPAPGESGYVEPLDDESWYQELRRSAPAYPQTPGGPQGPGSGPQRRAEPGQVPRSASSPAIRRPRTGLPATASPAGTDRARRARRARRVRR